MKSELVILAVFLLLASCSEVREFPVDSYQPSNFRSQEEQVRPDINRTTKIVEEETGPEPRTERGVPRKKVPQLSIPVEDFRLSVGYGAFRLNRSLGKYSSPFTKYEFPELLKSRNIRSRLDPVAASYEQFLQPLGGRVVLSVDEEGNPGDFLLYEDGEPVFEYRLELSQATFLDFVGEEIQMLGNSYVIKDATKEDVTLKHVGSGAEFVIGDGEVLLDGEVLEDTDSEFDGKSITVVSKADPLNEGDDTYIPFNHSLQEFLDEPTLLTDKLDVRYMGIPEVPHTIYEFDNKGDELELWITTPFREAKIPLAFSSETGFRLGDEEGKLHVREGGSKSDFKVERDDSFVLTNTRIGESLLFHRHKNDNRERVSIVFQYKGHDPAEKSIELGSREGIAIEAFYNGTPGSSAEGHVDFAGRSYKFAVGEDGSLAMDLNGDGRISGAVVDYMTTGAIVDLPSREEFNGSANVTFTFLNYGTGMKKEAFTVEIARKGDFVLQPFTNLEIFDVGNDREAAFSTFGTEYYFFNEERGGLEELVINHPLEERIAEVVIEAR